VTTVGEPSEEASTALKHLQIDIAGESFGSVGILVKET
jgi:hypothetical protein